MVARTERGLLLTCLWYIREVDPERLLLTGLTRDGVYLVEDGEVVGAVNNFRWNESPVELLGRITEVGAAGGDPVPGVERLLQPTVMPPVRVPDFNMSTVSQARPEPLCGCRRRSGPRSDGARGSPGRQVVGRARRRRRSR